MGLKNVFHGRQDNLPLQEIIVTCGTFVIEWQSVKTSPVLLQQTQIPFHWMLSGFCRFSFLSRLTALWENVMKFWSRVDLRENSLCVIVFCSIWYHSRQKKKRKRKVIEHNATRSKWAIRYCMSAQCKQSFPWDKRVCLASKLGHLALANIPFGSDNARGRMNEGKAFMQWNSQSPDRPLGTLIEKRRWTASPDATCRKHCDRSDRVSCKLQFLSVFHICYSSCVFPL